MVLTALSVWLDWVFCPDELAEPEVLGEPVVLGALDATGGLDGVVEFDLIDELSGVGMALESVLAVSDALAESNPAKMPMPAIKTDLFHRDRMTEGPQMLLAAPGPYKALLAASLEFSTKAD